MSESATQITHVYVFRTGMVAVFDASGQQVPEFQGRLPDVREKLAAVLPESKWILEGQVWPTAAGMAWMAEQDAW